jgi:hypothetical protein
MGYFFPFLENGRVLGKSKKYYAVENYNFSKA